MLRRLLNIASIICLVLCVVLMGMWVRSYFEGDYLSWRMTGTTGFVVAPKSGRLQGWGQGPSDWPFASSKNDARLLDTTTGHLPFLGFGYIWQQASGTTVVTVPYWFLVLTSGSLAMLFQLRWPPRFTLRSLFIVTTFLAVVLGMIAWLDRAWIGK
jgi:hypothetical protein